jgi:hypothetical protein
MEPIISTIFDLQTWIVALVSIALIGVVGTIHFALKNFELKKESEKKSIRLIMYDIDKEDLKDKLKQAEKSIKHKGLRKEIAKLKKANQDRIKTINFIDKEHQALCGDYSDLNRRYEKEIERNKKMMLEKFELNHDNEYHKGLIVELEDRIKHLTERIEHKKHQTSKSKIPDSDWWTPATDKTIYPQFEIGKIYKKGIKKSYADYLLCLIADDSIEYLVDKRLFMPAKKHTFNPIKDSEL